MDFKRSSPSIHLAILYQVYFFSNLTYYIELLKFVWLLSLVLHISENPSFLFPFITKLLQVCTGTLTPRAFPTLLKYAFKKVSNWFVCLEIVLTNKHLYKPNKHIGFLDKDDYKRIQVTSRVRIGLLRNTKFLIGSTPHPLLRGMGSNKNSHIGLKKATETASMTGNIHLAVSQQFINQSISSCSTGCQHWLRLNLFLY